MPLLDEVIDAFSTVPISLDIKPDDSGCARAVLDTIRCHRAELRVTVGSFHGHVIRRLRRLGYGGPTALTRGEVALVRCLPGSLCRPALRGQAAMIPRRHHWIRLDSETFIRRCRRLGLRVDYWVVNDPDAARSLISAGATGIVTDDPALMASVLARVGGA
jgi:glycerophosphoryl diester phosphodiesterase